FARRPPGLGGDIGQHQEAQDGEGEELRTLVSSRGNSSSRTAATEALLAAGPEGIAALRASLAHPDPAVRRFAARALDHVALEDETVEALVAFARAPGTF